MKKKLRIVLIILAVLLILFIVLGIWQWNNIVALFGAMRYSEQDISNLMTDNDKIVSEALEEYPDINVRGVEENEIKALEEGKITEKELVDIVLGKTSLEETVEQKENPKTPPTPAKDINENEDKGESKNEASPPTTEEPAQPDDKEEEIASLIAQIYVLKSSYTGRLDAVMDEARREFWKLPKDQQTTSAKQKILSAKLSRIAELESECDSKVEAIMTQLTELLKEQGKDVALVESIRKAYANEKQLRKSHYMSKYLD